MKIDKDSKMSTSSNQIKRDKSVDLSKEKAKAQEKAQKEKEKKERERAERERKEREKKEKERMEKERKEREKLMKKSQSNLNQSQAAAAVLPTSATASEINRLAKQQSQQSSLDQSQQSSLDMSNQQPAQGSIPSSKSENVLSIFKKSNSKLSNKKQQQEMTASQQALAKGRFRCQVVYLDESVKTFDLDVSSLCLIFIYPHLFIQNIKIKSKSKF